MFIDCMADVVANCCTIDTFVAEGIMVQQLAQHLPIKTKVAITSAKTISNSGNNITTWQ